MTMKRKSWQDYQKEIADDHYYYARSCIRQNFFPGSEKLFIDMLRNDLGKDLSDDPKHSSCTGIGYHSDIVPLETIMTVVARQFALMGEAGYENLVTSCITSFGVYTEILATWHEFPETEEKTRENLWKATRREFKKPASLAHTSDVVFHFREQIAARAKHRLVNAQTGEPLKVVEHIGCHYAKIFPKSGSYSGIYSYSTRARTLTQSFVSSRRAFFALHMKPKNVISASQQVIAIRPGTKLFFGKSGVFSTMPVNSTVFPR